MEKKRGLILAFLAIAAAGFGSFAHAQSVGVTLPSIPTGMTATIVPPAQVSMSWAAAAESSGTIEGYYVYRNGGQIGTTGGTTFIDNNITPGVYFYTVVAYDANGAVSAQSAAASLTFMADTTPPTTPGNVTVTGTTSTNSAYVRVPLTISWSPSTDNVGVVGYYVYRDGMQIITSTTAFAGTSITDMVTPDTYTYSVVAYDASQNYSDHSAPVVVTVGVDNSAPTAPTNLTLQQVSGTGVSLSWATSTDNIGVTGYDIYRGGVQVGGAAGPPYTDNSVSAGIGYSYTVAAYDAAGNVSNQSASEQITVQPTNGPGVPYVLSANLVGTSTVNFLWTPAGDVVPITGYNVYRNGTQIGSATGTYYVDMGLASGTYSYGVSATDLTGAVSSISSSSKTIVFVPVAASAVTPPAPAPMPATPSPVVSSNITSGAAPAPAATNGGTFTQFLYFGLRGSQVQDLQSFLAGRGYLSPANATGFFGSLTLHALQKFQCDQAIVCTGGAGWGTVGPKTRNALNGLQGSPGFSASSTSLSSISAMNAELQQLEAELANLEHQAQ